MRFLDKLISFIFNVFVIVVAVSIVYAFSGYGMMYYQILSWLDTVYLFPLLLIGLDNLTKGKSPLVYILVLFLYRILSKWLF